MVYYLMGKAPRKKPSSPPSKKQESLQAGGLSSGEAAQPASAKVSLVSQPVIHLLLIGMLGFLAYSNTFHSPFQWDEADYLVTNPFIRNLDYFAHPSKAELFLDNAIVSRYIGYLTFALNYQMSGLTVAGYHIVNLAIHLVNAMLVYFFVLLTFRTPYFKRETLDVKRETSVAQDQGSKTDSRFTIHDSRIVDHSPFTIHDSRLFALAVALLFVSHPVQTEAVTYVFQRFTSLVSMFYMLSLVLYMKGRQSAISSQQSAENARLTIHASRFTIIWYLLSLLAAVLAMKTKENAFTLPVMITLYEFLFFSGPVKSRLLRLTPFLLTMIIIPATLAGMSNTAAEIISQVKDPLAIGYEQLSRTDYLFTQFRVIVTYIRLLFLPLNQNIDYTYPLSRSFFEPRVLLSFIFLACLFAFAVYLLYKSQKAVSSKKSVVSSKKEETGNDGASTDGLSLLTTHYSLFTASLFTIHYSRLVAFGILWFFITLSVESGVIPIPMIITEYRMYLPSVGFFLALLAGVVLLLKQSSRFSRLDGPAWGGRFTKVAASLFALIIIGLASATYARNTLWKDKVSLWEDVVSKSPDSPRGYNNLGIAYYEKGLYEKAIEMYEHVLSLLPTYQNARVNMGNAYASIGRVDKAIEEFEQAIALDPKNSTAYANLGRAYAGIGRYDEAADKYIKAIELDHYNSTAYHGLGFVYVQLGRLDDALAAFTEFVTLSPKDPEAYRNRGNVYGYRGDFISAGADFRRACSLGSRESCNYLQDPRFR